MFSLSSLSSPQGQLNIWYDHGIVKKVKSVWFWSPSTKSPALQVTDFGYVNKSFWNSIVLTHKRQHSSLQMAEIRRGQRKCLLPDVLRDTCGLKSQQRQILFFLSGICSPESVKQEQTLSYHNPSVSFRGFFFSTSLLLFSLSVQTSDDFMVLSTSHELIIL